MDSLVQRNQPNESNWDRNAAGQMAPSSGYFQQPNIISVMPQYGGNPEVLRHELGHAFDAHYGVTDWATQRPYGQIADVNAYRARAAQLGYRVPMAAEVREYPYSAAFRAYMPQYPVGSPDNLIEYYAFMGQTPWLIPPELRMFYPQFTQQAFRPPATPPRMERVRYEDGSWGWEPVGVNR